MIQRENVRPYLEATLLELHDAGVVDAGSLGEDEDWKLVRIFNVLLQPDGSMGYSSSKL